MFSTNGIKAILFDLDGTLRHHIPNGSDVFIEYAIHLGLPISEDDKLRSLRWEHYYFAYSPEIRADQKTFQDNHHDFWINYCRRHLIALGAHPSQAIELSSAAAAYMKETHKPQVHVPQEVRDMLASMQTAGYILGVVSNREKPYQEELKELELDLHFNFSLAGGEIPSYKPEPAIFKRALELAGTRAPETVFVGDNYFADIVGSRRAGLRPVLYDPSSLFPEADCAVIKSFDELLPALKKM